VIGGGPAGVEAALAGLEEGAKVTLVEASDALPAPRSEWPSILSGRHPASKAGELLQDRGADVRCAERVLEVGSRRNVTTARSRLDFDSVVVATGSTPVLTDFRGCRKPGVHILGSEASYALLRGASLAYSRAVVSGAGHAALQVAWSLLRAGLHVTFAAPGGLLSSHFSLCVRELVYAAAAEVGMVVSEFPIQKAIGTDHVEAAVLGNTVLPCDCIVRVPSRVPSIPVVPAWLGPSGGIVVDSRMNSTVAGLHAAGDCAEYPVGNRSVPLMLDSTSRVCGRVAGCNAAGRFVSLTPIAIFHERILGLSISSAGLGLEDARGAGFEASESSSVPDGEESASVVFETRSRRVLGLQHVGRGRAPCPEFLVIALSRGILLEDLGSLESCGSTDISSVFEAAREGMRRWRRS
jgi:NADPH-dependent 2,4-dienoyl-CoA reductase/sulfur reductase-like enzyme